MPELQALEQLLEIDAIKQLKARYFRLLDTKQWDDMRKQFTDDCRYEGTTVPYADADAFIAGLRSSLATTKTVHQGHMPEIVLLGPTSARGIWAMFDYLEWPEGDTSFPRPADMWGAQGYGYYQEEYRKENGEWKISFLSLSRLRVDLLVGDRALPMKGLLAPALDWLPAR